MCSDIFESECKISVRSHYIEGFFDFFIIILIVGHFEAKLK